MMRTLETVLESTFRDLDRRVEERWTDGNLSHGFWRTGAIPRLSPVDTLREYGFWQAKADLSGLIAFSHDLHTGPADGSPADGGLAAGGGLRLAGLQPAGLRPAGLHGHVSVALIGGHTRIGVFLPNRLLDGMKASDGSLTNAVADAHDGQRAPIIRRMGGDTLFDRFFTVPPFSAEWLLRCAQDVNAQAVLEAHLAWRVIDIWESALRTVMSRQTHGPGIVIQSTKALPVDVTEALPLTLQDTYEIQPGHWVAIATPGVEGLDVSVMEAQLQTLFPGHGITMQWIG